MEQILSGLQPVSRKRILLALYLDFWMGAAAYEPLAWLALFDGVLAEPYVEYGLIALALALAFAFHRVTPGLRILGIRYVQIPGQMAMAMVSSSQVQKERWWIMLLGVLFIMEGSNNLVRWTQGLPPQPFFGDVSSPLLLFSFKSVLGLSSILAGVLLIKGNKAGALLGALLEIVHLVPLLVFQENFADWAEGVTLARRELQGLPVRDGEVEFMRQAVTMGMPALLMLATFLLFLAYFVLRRGSGDSDREPEVYVYL